MSVKIIYHSINDNQVPIMLINLKHRSIISIPTQLGCAIGCTFCISSEKEFIRSLTSKEMKILIEKGLNHVKHSSAMISFTGEGEPFLNLKHINKVMEDIHQKDEVESFRVCTSGIKPSLFDKVKKFSVPLNIQLSLHSPSDKVRKEIIPKSKPLKEILERLKSTVVDYDEIAVNYVLMKGINDSIEDSNALSEMVDPKWIVKLNPLLDENKYKKSSNQNLFVTDLLRKGKRVIAYNKIGSKISNGLYGNLVHSKNNRIA